MKKTRLLALTTASVLTLALAACSPPADEGDEATTKSGVKAAEAVSAADFGGMDGLVEAAQKEGKLNVIALPPNWANYGTPAFLGSVLLLFANAFAAYATAAALVSQGSPILPLLIRAALTSEVVLGQAGFAYALALEMIVVVTVVMIAYTAMVRRTSRWLQ